MLIITDGYHYPGAERPETPSTLPAPGHHDGHDYDYRTEINIVIEPPGITIIPVGGSISLICTGNLVWNGVSFTLFISLYSEFSNNQNYSFNHNHN